MKMFVIMSHPLSQGQKEDLKKMGVSTVVAMSEDNKKSWGQIDPQGRIKKIMVVNDLKKWLSDESKEGDYVLIQGEPGASFNLVSWCNDEGRIPVYATTVRESVEKTVDGKVIKTNVFKHIQFRRYEI